MSDETCSCQLVSIELTAFLSSLDDLAVLAGPREERRDCEQLRQSDGINGIHSPIFGDQCGWRKGPAHLQGRQQGAVRREGKQWIGT